MISTIKTAIVTGATKGIGKAVSTGLAQMGYQMVLFGRDTTDLKNVSKAIKDKSGIVALTFELDITNTESVKQSIQKIKDELGRIDVLVNNAGVFFDGTLAITEANFKLMLETNLNAQFVFLQEVVPIMKKQKSGAIFNIASRAGKIGFAGSGAYNASKFGLVGLNESLYKELVPLGISVTALCPGWVNTKMAVEAGTQLEGKEMIQPEDIFKTIQWLLGLSPGACVKEVILETPYSIS
ncbi:MAG TPA: SDR family oxidoreductase [Draconibacterium sp.]|nr:SDR family oxidoreductase [Draconibacterium sp.]